MMIAVTFVCGALVLYIGGCVSMAFICSHPNWGIRLPLPCGESDWLIGIFTTMFGTLALLRTRRSLELEPLDSEGKLAAAFRESLAQSFHL